jgi:sec-independent protein translocase protein TatB
MEILGIGPSELIFIVILAIIILGPKDMQKAGRTIGRWLNNIVRSDGYKAFQQTSREIRNLPTKLMRDANLELTETENEIRKAMNTQPNRPASTPTRNLPLPQEEQNSIQPPPAQPPANDPEPNDQIH